MDNIQENEKTPNFWFDYEHSEHGTLNVVAFIPDDALDASDVQVQAVAIADDMLVSPDEAGIEDATLEAMCEEAFEKWEAKQGSDSDEAVDLNEVEDEE